MSCGGKVAGQLGERLPAISVSWSFPIRPLDSGFLVYFADALEADLPLRAVCFDCLLDQGGEQLGRGMDLARKLRCQVDFDEVDDEWYVAQGGFIAEDEFVRSA